MMDKNIEETKKDKIIRLATDNPFLTLKEIAANVDTTERYVRSILSEANISLTKMRKEVHEELKSKYEEMTRQAN